MIKQITKYWRFEYGMVVTMGIAAVLMVAAMQKCTQAIDAETTACRARMDALMKACRADGRSEFYCSVEVEKARNCYLGATK